MANKLELQVESLEAAALMNKGACVSCTWIGDPQIPTFAKLINTEIKYLGCQPPEGGTQNGRPLSEKWSLSEFFFCFFDCLAVWVGTVWQAVGEREKWREKESNRGGLQLPVAQGLPACLPAYLYRLPALSLSRRARSRPALSLSHSVSRGSHSLARKGYKTWGFRTKGLILVQGVLRSSSEALDLDSQLIFFCYRLRACVFLVTKVWKS